MRGGQDETYKGEAKSKGSGQISPRYDLNVNLQPGLGDLTSPAAITQSGQISPRSDLNLPTGLGDLTSPTAITSQSVQSSPESNSDISKNVDNAAALVAATFAAAAAGLIN